MKVLVGAACVQSECHSQTESAVQQAAIGLGILEAGWNVLHMSLTIQYTMHPSSMMDDDQYLRDHDASMEEYGIG